MTECTQTSFTFANHARRQVVARFDGGTISSDGGAVLLRRLEQSTGIVRQFADCFRDHRQPAQIEHSVRQLVAQRVYGLALGYEDLNDHDQLRSDPLLALLSGKQDLQGKQRRRAQDRGKPGAAKSTLNRLEGTPAKAGASSLYKKIVLDTSAVDRLLTSLYVQSQPRQSQRIVLDLDATDDPLHGNQRRALFPRLLRPLLLPAALHFRRGAAAVRTPAASQYRRLGGVAGRSPAHRRTTAAELARSRDPAAGRQSRDPRSALMVPPERQTGGSVLEGRRVSKIGMNRERDSAAHLLLLLARKLIEFVVGAGEHFLRRVKRYQTLVQRPLHGCFFGMDQVNAGLL